jgi:hypothetical protein
MPWVFIAIMAVYGALCILFAFRKPPEAVEHFFKVPGIFAFLPGRWVMPAGRIFVGLCCFALCAFIVTRFV